MNAIPAQKKPRRVDPVVDRYIDDLQRRHQDFVRFHKLELRQIGLDVFTRIHHEYFSLPTKPAFEVLLQVILEPAERDRLLLDPQFTQAWQIFVDLCWMRARAVRTGILACAVLVGVCILAAIIMNSPHLGGVAMVGLIGMFFGIYGLPILLSRRRRR